MSRLMAKLCSRRGETLVEVMVSILVVGLAAAVLAGMTASASRVNQQANTATEAIYARLGQAEELFVINETAETLPGVQVQLTIDGFAPTNFNANYIIQENGFVAYVFKERDDGHGE